MKLTLHKMGFNTPRSAKSIRKQKRKETIAKLEKKVQYTAHGEERAEERALKSKKVRGDIISSIEQGKAEVNIKYKIHGSYGTYILSDDLKIITVLSKDMKDRGIGYKYLDKDLRKYLLNKIGLGKK